MATQHLKNGDPGFKYLPGPITHKLAQKLIFNETYKVKARFSADSLDRANRETITIGTAVEEHMITIRYDNEPGSLKDLLEAGADGTQIDYYPSIAGGTNFSMIVLTQKHDIVVLQDPDRHISSGEWMATVHVRMVGSDTLVGELT